MNKIRFILLLLLGTLLSTGSALHAQSQDDSLLWKISGNGLSEDSYLMGTLHLFCQESFSLNDQTENALNACQQVVLEAKTTEDKGEENIDAMLMRGDSSLEMFLSKTEYRELDSLFTVHTKMPLSVFTRFKPIFTAAMVMVNMLPCNPEEISGTEKLLQETAKANSIPVAELEGMEFQMKLMDSIALKGQVEAFQDIVRNFKKSKTLLKDMTAAYVSGNLSELKRLMDEQPDIMNMSGVLLDNRNRAWIPKMEKMMNAKPSFFAVGAGHLLGDNGLIMLLREAGYTVTPVN